MSRRACILLPAVALAASVACSGALAGAIHHPDCLPPHAKTITKNPQVRVYSLVASPTRGGTFACLLGRGTTLMLAKSSGYCCQSISHLILAAAIVAYTEGSRGVDSGCEDIVVVDVARKHTLLRVPNVACYVDAGIISFSRLTDFVLSPHGSVAWIVRLGGARQTATVQVRSAHADGTGAVLDAGPSIVTGSLRLSHGIASWDDAGQRRSAPLP